MTHSAAAVAVLTLFVAFAAPASHASYTDSPLEAAAYLQQNVQPGEADMEEMELLQRIFIASLHTVDVHKYTNSLTYKDKAILKLLDEKIPSIINKIQNNSCEVSEELNKAASKLARKIIANQDEYPTPENWDMVVDFTITTAITHALIHGTIDSRVAEILIIERWEKTGNFEAAPQKESQNIEIEPLPLEFEPLQLRIEPLPLEIDSLQLQMPQK